MQEIGEGMTANLITYLLIFTRITSFIVISPGFSFKSMPIYAKVLIALALTLGVSTGVPLITVEMNQLVLVFYLVREVLVGLAMGFISQLVFSAIEIAGQLIDFQVGFSMAAMFDPATGVQASNYGRLAYWLSLAIFFFSDMHLVMIESLLASFNVLPIGVAQLTSQSLTGTMEVFVEIFRIALGLAAPLMIVALITDIVLGIISRSVPQINVLMLGMPLKILASFFFMILLLPVFVGNIARLMPLMSEYVTEFVKSLNN